MAEREPSNELLAQAQENGAVTRTAHITRVASFKSKNNRDYYKIEFADGKSVTSFDPETPQKFHANMDVEYTVSKNEKTGYWDLKEIRPSAAKPPVGESAPAPEPVAAPFRGNDRDRQMMSMNAMTNSTNLVIESMKVSREFAELRPLEEVAKEAFSLIRAIHADMMSIHNPAPQENGQTGK